MLKLPYFYLVARVLRLVPCSVSHPCCYQRPPLLNVHIMVLHHVPTPSPHQATGVHTTTGAWAVDAEEAEYLEKQASQEVAFQQILSERKDWLKPPSSVPFSMVDTDGPSSKVQPEKNLAGNAGGVPEVGNVATEAAELVEQVRVQNGTL